MSNSVILFAPSAAVRPSVADFPAASKPTPRPTPRRRVRRRFWLLLMVTLLLGLLLSPAFWHAALRTLLTWQAARQGCDLTIDAVEGGPFDTFHLYGLRCRQRDLSLSSSAADRTDSGTDLRIARAEITLAWTLPWIQRSAPSWVRQITLDGVRGRWDLTPHGHHPGPGSGGRWFPRLDVLAARFVPANFLLRADDAALRRGRYHLRACGLLLSGKCDDAGTFFARTMEVGGPSFEATLSGRQGRTYWQGDSLTLADLDLGNGIVLARATLDGSRLGHRRLDWDGELRALGGTVRGQGAVDFSRERLALEVGGSLQRVTLGPLARLLEITGPADGLVEQASFSFRGNPENWLAADMWLAGRATDFRWGQRRWESLEMQAVVTNRRVEVHRLELRQSRNRLSLDGECSLPPDTASPGMAGRWWQAGFACNVDARLEDLQALAQLFGPPVPPIAGRMSVNGHLGARPGTQGFDGYLNVEGGALTVRGAPLDFLRSTLVFRGEELDVADLQVTHDGDYLTGRGSLRIAGTPDFQALGWVSIKDASVYAPAHAGLLPSWANAGGAPVRALTAGVRLEGSILYLDQCQGEQAGDTFQVGGSVDVRDAAHPVLDLSLTGEQPPRMADPADAEAAWRAGISYRLGLRGPLADGATLRGDVQLVHGHFDRPEEVAAAAPGPALGARLLQPLLRRLPEAWRDWPLDLSVTAASPLPSGGTGHDGEITPALEVTGTGRHPRLGGRLEFRAAAGSEQESGTWNFSPDQPGQPLLSRPPTVAAGTNHPSF